MLEVIIYIADLVSLLLLGVIAKQVLRAVSGQRASLQALEAAKIAAPKNADDLPSVTLCIPARNEQHALTECVQRALASTYPKLEIIVLDDVSGDDTSALIKAFASEGVRFVQGAELREGWLGKNHALQGLLDHASGTYLLFIDVDTLLAPQAIDSLIQYAQSEQVDMVSVLPRREDNWRASVLFSPLRYFWELVFQRRLSPASASNAWLIRREVLLTRFQGFHTLRNTIQPESKIAAELTQDGLYRFIIGTKELGVAYEKKWHSQLITAVRLVYPVLNNQAILAAVVAVDMAMMVLPFGVVITAVWWTQTPSFLLYVNGALALGFSAIYGAYAKHVWNKGWVVGALLWPVLIIQEIILVIASIIQYSRRTVKWKGRAIQPAAQN